MITLKTFEQGRPQRQWTFKEMVRHKDPSHRISFDPNQSMFSNDACFWHEFHYFVSQVYYGERLGIVVAQKFKNATSSSERKRIFDHMGAEEQLHCDVFEDYILDTFGSLFPMSSGLDKVTRMGTEIDDPSVLALVVHGVLEPVSMAIIKSLRKFVKDDYFQLFTDRVLRDEAIHIQLVPDPVELGVLWDSEAKERFHSGAMTAFKAMASAGRCKLLLKKLENIGIDLSKEQPFKSPVYQKKYNMTIKLVSGQVAKAGIDLFSRKTDVDQGLAVGT